MAQCKRIRKNGEQCRRFAVTGYTVCQIHGAGSPLQGRPGGIPKVYKAGGRYSKYLPTRLAERFDEMANDPELLSLNSELRLVDVRLSELTARVDTGESGEIWTSIKSTYAKLVAAFREKDADAISSNLRELNTLINHGEGDYKAWEQIADLVEQRRKLTESEQKRIISAGHMLRMDEAQRLMGALTASVRKHVNDTAILERINAEFIRLSERSDKSGTLADQDDSE